MDGNTQWASAGTMTLTDNATGKSVEFRSSRARSAPRSSISASSTSRPVTSPTTRALWRPPPAAPASPISTATRASCCIAAIRSRSWPAKATFSKSPTCCSTASCRPQRRRSSSSMTSPTTRWCTSSSRPSSAASAATRTRWRCCAAWSARSRPSITTRPTSMTRISGWSRRYRLIAKMPTMAAMAFKYSLGQPFIYPKNSLGYAENFLHMTFAVPCEEYKVNPVLARAMDRIFILHADHEQNASTATVRNAGSSGANPFACIAAGIASLWGPAHGGANEAVLEDAGPDRRQVRHQGLHQPGQGQAQPRDPVRLRSSRVQELRSARACLARELPRSARRARHQGRSVARPGDGAREDRAQRRLLHQAASCTRTSISIRASSARRWVSRPRCSPCCSRLPARSAGSRSGPR